MTTAEAPPAGGVVLLAAGRSRRFGADKRKHRMPDGRSMLTHSIERYCAAFARCILVLRPDDPDPELPTDRRCLLRIVRAVEADRGMGHSLAAAATAAADWDYVFVALADMPWVRPATLAALRSGMEAAVRAGSTDSILQPLCGGTPGHPVGFSARYLQELGALAGDQGARSVIGQHRQHLQRIELGDPGTLLDVDTPDQIES